MLGFAPPPVPWPSLSPLHFRSRAAPGRVESNPLRLPVRRADRGQPTPADARRRMTPRAIRHRTRCPSGSASRGQCELQCYHEARALQYAFAGSGETRCSCSTLDPPARTLARSFLVQWHIASSGEGWDTTFCRFAREILGSIWRLIGSRLLAKKHESGTYCGRLVHGPAAAPHKRGKKKISIKKADNEHETIRKPAQNKTAMGRDPPGFPDTVYGARTHDADLHSFSLYMATPGDYEHTVAPRDMTSFSTNPFIRGRKSPDI